MDSENLLGEFLRARREVTTPRQVGLLHVGPRRTPGLRREEVAMLADVSTDYYIRLEQGRERHPSERVLCALVRVLDLGPDAAAHLYELAHPRTRPRRAVDEAERVGPDLLRLMRGWAYTPAFVCNRWMDVLATNMLADALFSGLEHGDNLVRAVFLDSAARTFYRDWEKVARSKVAHLRAATGADLDHPYLTELVDELSGESDDFRRMWARHDVVGKTHEAKRLHHHEVGDLTLTCELFNVGSAPGQQLHVFQAEPASPSEHALALLGSLAIMTP
ncbi:helix-turn-helix transcriptional regulator [Streptosporangium lutulentum]|uniref:Transcriptional regulator with XRE-family HTH domain n=1 Tax=Streptosporangium lutulentum TaxID=1461250 RepID=A0ABT9QKM9_9ACTN|nr:helix-turn-helix transcriptional regulator [Streptosporangium lutulentum]MDP9846936.1 transcriptional regulator with XRE-family HTH domain [Streptosporangium lutulentum]